MADETEVPQTTTGTDVDATPTEGEQQMDVEAPNGTEKPEENGAEEALVEASKRSREGEEGEGAEEGEGENGAAKKHKSDLPADEGLEQDEEKEGPEDAEGRGGDKEYVEGGGGGGEEYVEGGGGEGEEGEGDGEGGEEEEGHEEGYEEGMEQVKEGGAPADVPADGPTKESTPVSLGPKVFKTSVEMFDYFIKLLHYWPPNVDVNKYELMVLTDLIKKGHPDPEKKNGIRAFQVRFHPMWQSRCFFIMREDGHCDDFSFRKCVDKILPLPPHMKANAGNARSGGHYGGGRGGGGGGRGGGGGGGGRGGGRFRGRGRGRRGGFRN